MPNAEGSLTPEQTRAIQRRRLKPRIAVVTQYWPFPEEAYRGQTAYQTLRLLIDRAEIRAFCPLPVYPRTLRPKKYDYLPAARDFSPPDIATQYFEYPAIPAISRPFNGTAGARAVLPAVSEFRPDLVLSYWIYPEGYAAVSVARKLGVPSVVCAIGSDLKCIPGAVSRYLTRWTLEKADFVLAVSEDLRQEAVALGADSARSATIGNGCDTSIFTRGDRLAARKELGIDSSAHLVVFVGRVVESKGVLELREAVHQLAASFPTIKAVLIGDGPLREELSADERLILPGRQGSPAIAQWLAAADVFCLPSHSEGCPNVVVEALACGSPVVASSVGGIPFMIDDASGLLTPPRNPAALTAALDQALRRTWDSAEIERRNRRSWQDAAEDNWRIFASLLHLSEPA